MRAKVIVILFFVINAALCQQIAIRKFVGDTQPSLEVANFQELIDESLCIYNAKEYIPHPKNIRGSAFFLGDSIRVGKLGYDGILYEDVALRFDLVSGTLLMVYPNRVFTVELIQDLIQYFNIDGHYFTRLKNPDTLDPIINENLFYEQVYSGNAQLYRAYESIIVEKIENEKLDQEFHHKNLHYLFKNNHFYKIANAGEIFKILGSYKTEIKKNLKEQKISLRQNREKAFLEILRQYDFLIKNEK